jgi:hypothetical protein
MLQLAAFSVGRVAMAITQVAKSGGTAGDVRQGGISSGKLT